jgi:hypothetical protein
MRTNRLTNRLSTSRDADAPGSRDRMEDAIRAGKVKGLSPARARQRGLLDPERELDGARRVVDQAREAIHRRA